jgi:hypothetical protein
MRKGYLKLLALLMLLFPLSCPSCAPHLQPVKGESYSDPQGYFEVSMPWAKSHLPHNGWQLLSWKGVDFVLWDQKEGATIVVDVTPLKEEADLANLTRHLLIAFERKQIISQNIEQVQGREAVKTLLEAWVERTEIKAEIYVVRGEGVRYDIIFWAPRDAFPRTVEAFRQFLVGITFLQP